MRSRKRAASHIERLYRDYGRALVLFARSICGEHGRAEDAVHQVFLKLMNEHGLRNVENPKAYLFTCVRNAVINDTKSLQRTTPLEDEGPWFEPPQRDYSTEINLRSALAALPDEQRQIVVLHVWGELTFSQLAEVLNISANTAASRYRYGIAKLREAMSAKELPNGT